MVCLLHIVHQHTKDSVNKTEVGILGNQNILQHQFCLPTFIVSIQFIWKIKRNRQVEGKDFGTSEDLYDNPPKYLHKV